MTLTRKQLIFAGFGSALLALTLLVYYPGLSGPFIFDDLPNILFNPALQKIEFTYSAFKDVVLSSDSGTLKRPLSMFTFALNTASTGFDVFYYKITNLLIHTINGILISCLGYMLLRRYNRIRASTPLFSNRQLQLYGLLAGCLWLLHPLNLTSVLYVVQRMTSLSTLFMIAGLLVYILGRERLIVGNRSGFWLILTLPLWTAAATLSKEIGVLLPVYALLVELYFYQFRAAALFQKRFRWALATVILLPIVVGAGLLVANIDSFLNYRYQPFTLEQRLLTEARVLWFYISLIAVPMGSRMGLFHDDFVVSTGLLDPLSTIIAVIGIIFLFAFSVIARRHIPLLSFGILWFLTGHSLESSIFPLETVHEHRNYLPQVGLIICLVYYVLFPYKTRGADAGDSIAQYALVIIFALVAAYETHNRSGYWRSDLSLAAQETRAHPESVRANTYLAITLHEQRQYRTARHYFTKAVDLDPNNPNPRIRLMQHLYQAGRPVPDKLIDETARITLALPFFDPDVLTTMDPLLLVTVANAKLNNKLVSLYEDYINRNDANKIWRLFAYKKLVNLFKTAGTAGRALPYLQKIHKLDKSAVEYYLESAEILTNMGKHKQAQELLASLQSSNIILDSDETNHLNKLIRR